jgi:hypothetical protein
MKAGSKMQAVRSPRSGKNEFGFEFPPKNLLESFSVCELANERFRCSLNKSMSGLHISL